MRETVQYNQGLRNRQYTREQAGTVAQYLSQYNSQAFYEAQPYLEPVAPFVPLPSLLMPPPPTMTGAGPSRAAGALRIGTSLLEGGNYTMGPSARFSPWRAAARGTRWQVRPEVTAENLDLQASSPVCLGVANTLGDICSGQAYLLRLQRRWRHHA